MISNQSTSKKYVYDQPLSQRNRATERTVGVGDVGEREVGGGGVDKILKRRVDNIGVFIK